MKTLTWPHSSQNYYAMDSLHQQSTPTYFKMTKFIYSTDSVDPVITQNNMSLTPEYLRISKNVYTKIFFINLFFKTLLSLVSLSASLFTFFFPSLLTMEHLDV